MQVIMYQTHQITGESSFVHNYNDNDGTWWIISGTNNVMNACERNRRAFEEAVKRSLSLRHD